MANRDWYFTSTCSVPHTANSTKKFLNKGIKVIDHPPTRLTLALQTSSTPRYEKMLEA
ncbi:Hypothetical protein FKW44_007617 [Caligus rogercresseyi]|uniref:Uncharacterized protein n=1 Tax=Caligus rogercresseyi TaxID=217165 RepID=A0A7T8KF02_CALRO|nr:Hypothetical protein FKW44_007617 [Caligus rogercresseyi]